MGLHRLAWVLTAVTAAHGCTNSPDGSDDLPAPGPVFAPPAAVPGPQQPAQAGAGAGPGAGPGARPLAQPMQPAAMPAQMPSETPVETPSAPAGNGPQTDGPASFLADMGDGWNNLVQGTWSLPAGSEGYVCVRYTLPESVSFKSLKPISPIGTHHTVVSYDDTASAPDGTTDCDAFTNGEHILGASGVGTEATEPLPDGVSFTLPQGAQLVLNLHLFNASESELSGTSGTLIALSEDGADDIRAENILAGSISLDIPPGEVVQSGRCTFPGKSTIVQVFPHMHQIGRHMKIVAHSSVAGDVVLFDDAYDFELQLFYPVGPVEMAAGDHVTVECTYQNDTGQTVRWGDSSNSEMCFAGLVRYPALGGNLGIACTN